MTPLYRLPGKTPNLYSLKKTKTGLILSHIDILIPTYNRSGPLSKNLQMLANELRKEGLKEQVSIIISDNASPDDTRAVVKDFIDNNPDIHLAYHCQPRNVGLEQNAVDVLHKASASYVMFVGDDDFLPTGYLSFCMQAATSTKIGYVVPGLASLMADGTLIPGRRESFDRLYLKKGFTSMFLYSHLGHQMSGILLLREKLLVDYLSHERYRTPYLFIYLLANRMWQYDGYYVPEFKVKVSMGNAKDWSYNQIGLLDEVYKAYYPFISIIGEKKTKRLLLRFTVMHSYRIDFSQNLWKNFINIKRSALPIKGFSVGLLWLLIKEYFSRKVLQS
jgi:glycosyltransferase involved in cell wall biosynthesis